MKEHLGAIGSVYCIYDEGIKPSSSEELTAEEIRKIMTQTFGNQIIADVKIVENSTSHDHDANSLTEEHDPDLSMDCIEIATSYEEQPSFDEAEVEIEATDIEGLFHAPKTWELVNSILDIKDMNSANSFNFIDESRDIGQKKETYYVRDLSSSAPYPSNSNSDIKVKSDRFHTFKTKCKQVMSDLFLPLNYPHSVNNGYIQYQIFDATQGLCSYLRGVVSNTAVLRAAGVGDATATASSAAIQWALKDGVAMVGGLLFSYYNSSYFDSHVKEFRLFADVINDVGLFLDMASPIVISSFPQSERVNVAILITSIATLCRVMCGMAAGATKNCITQHFAKTGNVADLSAKEGTQETLISLVGMILGIYIARFLQDMEDNASTLESGQSYFDFYKNSPIYASWYIFILLTFIHVWANYVAVKILHLTTLNRSRLESALHGIIREGRSFLYMMTSENTINKETTDSDLFFIPSPEKCTESLRDSIGGLLFHDGIHLGATITNLLLQVDCPEKRIEILKSLDEDNYALTLRKRRTYPLGGEGVSVYFLEQNPSEMNPDSKEETLVKLAKEFVDYVMDDMFLANSNEKHSLLDILESHGWNTSCIYLNLGSSRYEVIRKYEE
ncbi:hypothetical protein CTEN210_07959 [Chaetoceros tenuissimus]|uniref:Protein root UVB sensitive/RUS domain-containing protein n=1 Tax=Chaetoceros tenuissimus TaxID=426638 RepID=A0AAD3H666_9STRA|nr:hypothetical protein CTEN210_07959 [Chaetoceros tenuissimus]